MVSGNKKEGEMKMSQKHEITRRVVTAIDADGNSYIAEDGPTPASRTVDARPGYVVNNIWVTGAAPSVVGAPVSPCCSLGARQRAAGGPAPSPAAPPRAASSCVVTG